MSESERNERRRVVAMVGNPTSDKGRGAKWTRRYWVC